MAWYRFPSWFIMGVVALLLLICVTAPLPRITSRDSRSLFLAVGIPLSAIMYTSVYYLLVGRNLYALCEKIEKKKCNTTPVIYVKELRRVEKALQKMATHNMRVVRELREYMPEQQCGLPGSPGAASRRKNLGLGMGAGGGQGMLQGSGKFDGNATTQKTDAVERDFHWEPIDGSNTPTNYHQPHLDHHDRPGSHHHDGAFQAHASPAGAPDAQQGGTVRQQPQQTDSMQNPIQESLRAYDTNYYDTESPQHDGENTEQFEDCVEYDDDEDDEIWQSSAPYGQQDYQIFSQRTAAAAEYERGVSYRTAVGDDGSDVAATAPFATGAQQRLDPYEPQPSFQSCLETPRDDVGEN